MISILISIVVYFVGSSFFTSFGAGWMFSILNFLIIAMFQAGKGINE
jgi:hypothetical protein